MSNVLFLVHRIPYPPDKGDKIRSFNILRFLSARYKVYLGGFVDRKEDNTFRDVLGEYCEDVFLRPIGGWRSKIGTLGSIARRQALGLGYYQDAQMSAWVSQLLLSGSINSVFAFSSTMAQYCTTAYARQIPVVADFVDVDSDKWRQYAENSLFPRSLIYRYEANALVNWERRVSDCADVVTVVSRAERDLLCGLLGESKARIEVVKNGVDVEFFDPNLEHANPYPPSVPVVVFTGAMDYYPNQDAVVWFVKNVWPKLRRRVNGIRFYIVGGHPSAAVQALSTTEGITVTGRVPDVRPYLAHASVAVAPLRLARGVQNKVLEALSMGLPVVATSQAAHGLDGDIPENVSIADDGSSFANLVLNTFSTDSIGDKKTGRLFVIKNYDWDKNLSVIPELLSLENAVESAQHRGVNHGKRLDGR